DWPGMSIMGGMVQGVGPTEKSAGFAPPRNTEIGPSGTPPTLVSVKTCCFGCVTTTRPKSSTGGASASAGAATPLPVTVAMTVIAPAAATSVADLFAMSAG